MEEIKQTMQRKDDDDDDGQQSEMKNVVELSSFLASL